ncbi:hypothetical protein EL26_08275 [Tumebacillus flagellatus]|uniref:Uncharacterized protein n=1 Tax=Tumebacillus flagellatus TaxID=1157490 RepID=A0A074LNE6_9BACL|nr:hypothetical protein EL26_08275 [Tumebacillus flagellatus]
MLSLKPLQPISAIHFTVPPALANQLAAYWVNEGDNVHSLLFLGPKGWNVQKASFATDGSMNIRLVSPQDPKQYLNLLGDGGCAGCALRHLGTVFPNRTAAASEFAGQPVELGNFPHTYAITPRVMAISLGSAEAGYEANAVDLDRTEDNQYSFDVVEIKTKSTDLPLQTVILNFYWQESYGMKS